MISVKGRGESPAPFSCVEFQFDASAEPPCPARSRINPNEEPGRQEEKERAFSVSALFPTERELGIEPWERDVESIMHRGVVVVEFFVVM